MVGEQTNLKTPPLASFHMPYVNCEKDCLLGAKEKLAVPREKVGGERRNQARRQERGEFQAGEVGNNGRSSWFDIIHRRHRAATASRQTEQEQLL